MGGRLHIPVKDDIEEWVGNANFGTLKKGREVNSTSRSNYGGVGSAYRDDTTSEELVGMLAVVRGTSPELVALQTALATRLAGSVHDASSFEKAVRLFLAEMGMERNGSGGSRRLIGGIPSEGVALARRQIYATFELVARTVMLQGSSTLSEENAVISGAMDTLAAALVAMHYQRIAAVQKLNPVPSQRGKTAALHFLHISKSGGTTMCAGFHKNCGHGQLPPSSRDSEMPHCWIKGTGPIWEAPRKHSNLGCEELDALYASKAVSFLSNEGYLMGGTSEEPLTKLCNKALLHVTLLRNPFSRTMSHSVLGDVHVTASEDTLEREIKKCRSKDKAECNYHSFTLQERMAANPSIFNNYIHRVLLGPNVYHAAPATLTKKHLLLAQQQLARFDTVVVLEDKVGMRLLLEKMLLASDFNLDSVMKRHRKKKSVEKVSKRAGAIYDGNLLDFHVWRFGWLIYKLDYQMFHRGDVGGGHGKGGGGGASTTSTSGGDSSGHISVCGDVGMAWE